MPLAYSNQELGRGGGPLGHGKEKIARDR